MSLHTQGLPNERVIARALLKALIDAGYTCGIYDGVDTTIKDSNDVDALLGHMCTVDDEHVIVYQSTFDENGVRIESETKQCGWVRLIYGNGNDGLDVICDHNMSLEHVMAPFFKRIEDAPTTIQL